MDHDVCWFILLNYGIFIYFTVGGTIYKVKPFCHKVIRHEICMINMEYVLNFEMYIEDLFLIILNNFYSFFSLSNS